VSANALGHVAAKVQVDHADVPVVQIPEPMTISLMTGNVGPFVAV
jgi:hypothetical protein